jgi:hypothetical protein
MSHQCTSCCIFRFSRLAILFLQQTHTSRGFAYLLKNCYCEVVPLFNRVRFFPPASLDSYRAVAYPGILFRGGGGVQQIQLRTEGKENGDLGAVDP